MLSYVILFRPNVRVEDLYTEPNLDVLRLYSGPEPVGDELALSGAITRNGPVTYRSSNESLFATFVTDDAVAVRGFRAQVTQELASDSKNICSFVISLFLCFHLGPAVTSWKYGYS